MRSTFFLSVVTLFLVADLAAQRERRSGRGGGGDDSSVELAHFEFKKVDYSAFSLESLRSSYGIYLPKGYGDEANKDRRYPWVIWLHGMNGDYRRFHTGAAATLDKLRGEGQIPEMIFVAASGPRRTLYLNGESSGDVEDLIAFDLLEHVQKNFRASNKRRDRAIMGVSIGALGAMKIAFKYPEKFGTVAIHSGAMFPVDPDDLPAQLDRQAQFMSRSIGFDEVLGNPIEPEKWMKEIPSAMLTKMKVGKLKGLRIFLDAGTDDRYGFAPLNIAFHEQLQEKKIAHSWELIEGGGHAWADRRFPERVARSLQFVGAGFSGQGERGAEKSKKGGADKANR
ncbi:MAG: alpha/beta hydrolase-fold protein [Planctomycetota bacterium]|jgi:S-formylglutathione hydrolase|nr:alpha/beta hydrolase-fold protein [Planctomycetota bacterium]